MCAETSTHSANCPVLRRDSPGAALGPVLDMPVIVQRQMHSLRVKVVDISVVAQKQFPLVLFRKPLRVLQLQIIDKVLDVCCASPASSGAVGVETVELPQLQPIERGHCCRMPVVCNNRCRVVPSAENSRRSRSCSALTIWSMSLLAQFIDGYGRPYDHAATLGLATVEAPHIQFIARVSGHSSSQQRRVRSF